MKNEDRLIEVMAELLAEVHEMRVDMKTQMHELNGRMEKLEVQQTRSSSELVKVNLQLGENTRAILKLADKIEVVPDLIERVIRLEAEVFRKAS
jgi:uncharacterized coiled-coil protein SlyX